MRYWLCVRCNIVGNGPSRCLWDGEGFAIGSNAASDVNCVVITDKHVIDKIVCKTFRPAKPVILGPNAWEHAMSQRNVWRRIHVLGCITKTKQKHVQNAGQAGVLWALRMGLKDIHLWGFDSLWTRNRETLTDEVFPKDKPTNPMVRWDKGWNVVWEEFPDCVLTVHAPQGAGFVATKHFKENTQGHRPDDDKT